MDVCGYLCEQGHEVGAKRSHGLISCSNLLRSGTWSIDHAKKQVHAISFEICDIQATFFQQIESSDVCGGVHFVKAMFDPVASSHEGSFSNASETNAHNSRVDNHQAPTPSLTGERVTRKVSQI